MTIESGDDRRSDGTPVAVCPLKYQPHTLTGSPRILQQDGRASVGSQQQVDGSIAVPVAGDESSTHQRVAV